MSPAEMVKEFIFSEENQAKLSGFTNEEFLAFLYNVLLFREPETEGLNTWLARMDGGMTMEEVVDGFLFEEFGNMCTIFGI